MARYLHDANWNIVIHYFNSDGMAQQLADELNAKRENSAHPGCADLSDICQVKQLADSALAWAGHIDAVINNASTFFPTPIISADEEQWDALFSVNVKAPFFLAQRLYQPLKARRGSIINIVDIHAERPLKNHALYSISKAAMAMLTRVLAREFAPEIRCNGIAPGAILWPEAEQDRTTQENIIDRTALKKKGTPNDIAKAALFLLENAPYVTGQIITVDGGRTLKN